MSTLLRMLDHLHSFGHEERTNFTIRTRNTNK